MVLGQLDRRRDSQEQRHSLLALALADRLTDLVFPAAERASKLNDLIIREKPSPQAEGYLEEACLCYFYELYSASAVMCRSVLEEVIERRLRRLNLDELQSLNQTDYTLGTMLGIAERPDLR